MEVFQLRRSFTSRGQNTWYQQMYRHGCWLTSESIPTLKFHADMLQIKRSPIKFWWLCLSCIPLTLIHQMSDAAPMIMFPILTHSHHSLSLLFLLSSLYPSPKRVKLPSPWFRKCFCSVLVLRKSQWWRVLSQMNRLPQLTQDSTSNDSSQTVVKISELSFFPLIKAVSSNNSHISRLTSLIQKSLVLHC